MGWLEAIVLGLVQGLTEFIPVSSSAHQLIVGQLFHHDPGAAFTAVNQLGTMLAVIVFFFRDIVHIIKQWALSLVGKVDRSDMDARMGWFIIVGSIPIGVIGLLFQDQIENGLRNLWITVGTLAGVGVILWIADWYSGKYARKGIESLTWRDAVIYGLCQTCALIPGVSRSGSTIAGGLFLGYKRVAATRYSFLLSIPAVLASGLYELKGIGGTMDVGWTPTIIATVIAFIVGFASIAWLLRFVSTHNFRPFVIYRVLAAIAVAILVITHVISPMGA
ncbi:MAG: undecaprenyl-diphosphate phosphatase [Propionibacteriaceae bacterium]|nr:undecaprenyl-diphosphate phosphatase [Propionibacteriaceae bacterium]